MKKVLSLLLAVVMMFSLVACGGGEGGETSDVTTYKVGVAIYQFDDNFMTNYRNELVDYFKTKETDTVKYEVTLVDGKNDMATQTDRSVTSLHRVWTSSSVTLFRHLQQMLSSTKL